MISKNEKISLLGGLLNFVKYFSFSVFITNSINSYTLTQDLLSKQILRLLSFPSLIKSNKENFHGIMKLISKYQYVFNLLF